MQLAEQKPVLTVRATLTRFAVAALGMTAAVVLTGAFHVTPTLAESKPQAAQPAVVSGQNQITPASAAESNGNPAPADSNPVDRKKKPSAAHIAAPENVPEPHPSEPAASASNGQPDLHLQMEELHKELAALTARIHAETNNKNFQQPMEETRKQMEELKQQLASGEIQRAVAESQKQMGTTIDRQLQQQMKDLQMQLQNGEIQKQMEEVQKQLNSGEFKKQLEDAIKALQDEQKQLQDALPH